MSSATPRLRSQYPSTPQRTPPGSYYSYDSPAPAAHAPPARTALPVVPSSTSTQNDPLIPLTLIDAPTQRFYVVAIYVLLLAWRFSDWVGLMEDDAESFWLFLKWAAIDGVFLYGLPGLRIPWLEWSNSVITVVFLAHAVLNGILMFRIPIWLPLESWLMAMAKVFYDRELSIRETSVKPANILHNSSLIMGKQIINILPEGSASLNPDALPLCIDKAKPSVNLPIRLNQTIPKHIELLRIDLETNANETIEVKGKDAKAIKKQVEKMRKANQDDSAVINIEYAVKKPGLYRLLKVIDESNLEVQKRTLDTFVVECPKAFIQPAQADKCVNDLSNLTMTVEGTPPLKIVYSRSMNKKDQSFHFQSIQPEDLDSPLVGSSRTVTHPSQEDVTWARSRSIDVRLNETMTHNGDWLYAIDEIHDAMGNVANFTDPGEDDGHLYPKGSHLMHRYMVHDRPIAKLEGCGSRNPLQIASGTSTNLPVKIGTQGHGPVDTTHTISWQFSPLDKLTENGDHADDAAVEQFVLDGQGKRPSISQPGLYSLRSVHSTHCDGEIQEPASCLLLNPPRPNLSISSENIFDKCAGSSIGLLVDLDLIGTPPFLIRYDEIHEKQTKSRSVRVDGLRHQLELKPQNAGHFIYRFTSIDDDVYEAQPLIGEGLVLEQDVKPPASATIVNTPSEISACIEEPVRAEVHLHGEPPFTLEYELVHGGKRQKEKVFDIEGHSYTIATKPLTKGGEYSLALATVQDKTGCRVFLSNEVKIDVRHQRPKAAFGKLEGKRSVTTLEGLQVALPLRLEGEPSWSVRYRNLNDSTGKIMEAGASSSNAVLKVTDRGVYEIIDVFDRQCPGNVEPKASTFEVDWAPRPRIKLADSSLLIPETDHYLKREVCEGDVDAVDIKLEGAPPFHLEYQQRYKPESGSSSVTNKQLDAALSIATIPMDTSKAGRWRYEFSELSDGNYNHDPRGFSPLVVEQTVNSKPSAHFTKPSQSYKYCHQEEAGSEVIPITLVGQPPFYMEIDIKHQSSTRPETVKIANIESTHYDFRIPHNVLSLGTHQVSVRKVRDARGCQQKTEFTAPHVTVQVFDVPTIYPVDSRTDYCVGDRLSYTLSGVAPFTIYHKFEGVERTAKSTTTGFRRIAEKPGEFTITGISDRASDCKAKTDITKIIHEMPAVRISKGRQVEVDIHEGGVAEILFEFWGTPPFEFTYTRSTNAKKNQKSQVLETRHETSYEHSKTVLSSQEGTYEVIAIKDQYCSFSTQPSETKGSQKLLQY